MWLSSASRFYYCCGSLRKVVIQTTYRCILSLWCYMSIVKVFHSKAYIYSSYVSIGSSTAVYNFVALCTVYYNNISTSAFVYCAFINKLISSMNLLLLDLIIRVYIVVKYTLTSQRYPKFNCYIPVSCKSNIRGY